MKVWLYYRLSRDEDEEQNSLMNQRKILLDYAEQKEHEVVGESFDDNVSGMHFNREGINKIYEIVEAGGIEAILVKDLSRLGRHRTQTALFIDYLAEKNVRVLSVTENIDTSNENDDLLVGFKGLLNDVYAKDISRKGKSGFRQKQKEGLIMIAPFGYFKDKNTKQVVIVEEAAEIVRLIFKLYIDGYGLKAVAKILNDKGYPTPAYFQEKLLGKRSPCTWPEIAKRGIWINTTVKRILKDEIYTGTLINHKTESVNMGKSLKIIPPEELIRHENFLPAIITREQWEQAQFLLKDRPTSNVRAGKQKIHRYTSLIVCKDCGRNFTAKKRKWEGTERIEYVCGSYHRYGKEYCTPRRIREDTLDRLILDELQNIKSMAAQNWQSIEKQVRDWTLQKSNVERQMQKLSETISTLELEIEKILMERISDKPNADRYDRMIEKREQEIIKAREQIENYQDMDTAFKKKRQESKKSIDLIDEIIANGGISDTHLRMLIDKIIIMDVEGMLDLEICLKADFRHHYDFYDNFLELIEYDLETQIDEKWEYPTIEILTPENVAGYA